MKTVAVKTQLTKIDLARLEILAERTGVNLTDALRNAITLAEFISSERERGGKILVQDTTGARRELLER